MLLHPEARVVRAGVGDDPGPGVQRVGERGDIGETAQGLGVRRDKVIVDAREQLVGVESAQHGENPVHPGISERRMQVSEPVLDRGGAEVVADFDVLAEADLKPERGQLAVSLGPDVRADDRQRP